MVERQNRTIQQMLSAYVNEKRDGWSDHLDLIMMAYRSSVHQSTQSTPNLIMFGREVNLPLTVEHGVFPTGDRPQCPAEYVEWVQNTLERVFFPFCEGEHSPTLTVNSLQLDDNTVPLSGRQQPSA